MENKISLNDIHDINVEHEFARLAQIDIATIIEKKSDFIDSPCPACKSRNIPPVFEYQGFSYKRCKLCELLFISPAPTEELHIEYLENSKALKYWRENMPDKVKNSRLEMYKERVKYISDIKQKYNIEFNKVLEIGAGNGELATIIATDKSLSVSELVLVEPQPMNVEFSNVRIIQDVFTNWKSHDKFNVIIAFEVIEHILNPDYFFKKILGLLSNDGIFIFSTPNEKSLETRTLGTLSSNIFFDHVRLYNPVAIQYLLENNGFSIVDLCTPGVLDIEMINRQYQEGKIDLNDRPALKYLLEELPGELAKFQNYLQSKHLSSHMRCVARKAEK